MWIWVDEEGGGKGGREEEEGARIWEELGQRKL